MIVQLLQYLKYIRIKMSSFYTQLCNMFIRPSRQSYNKHDLGNPSILNIGRRIDFQITNPNNLKLVCSFFRNTNHPLSLCVIYLHGFNGSRLESLSYAEKILSLGFNMCSFDFAGTGNSQGEYVSLGHHEQFDVYEVVKTLFQKYNIKRFALWGRSMGAVAAMKFYSLKEKKKWEKESSSDILRQIQITSLVLDSPFYSLSELSLEIARTRIKIPQLLIKAVFMVIRSTIEQKANFKIEDLQLLKDASKLNCPVLLLASREDRLINFEHSEKIYKTIQHKQKQIVFIKGQHNECRQLKVIDQLLNFIKDKTKLQRTQRHNSCASNGKKLQSYQSTKCLNVVEEIDEFQKIDTSVRIRYFPQNPSPFSESSVQSRFSKQFCSQNRIGSVKKIQFSTNPRERQISKFRERENYEKIKTLKEIPEANEKIFFNNNYLHSPKVKEKDHHQTHVNCHKLKFSTQLKIPSKKDESKVIQHMNVIGQKLKKKKKPVKVEFKKNEQRLSHQKPIYRQWLKESQQQIALKSEQEIRPKEGIKIVKNQQHLQVKTPIKRPLDCKGLSLSQKIVKFS